MKMGVSPSPQAVCAGECKCKAMPMPCHRSRLSCQIHRSMWTSAKPPSAPAAHALQHALQALTVQSSFAAPTMAVLILSPAVSCPIAGWQCYKVPCFNAGSAAIPGCSPCKQCANAASACTMTQDTVCLQGETGTPLSAAIPYPVVNRPSQHHLHVTFCSQELSHSRRRGAQCQRHEHV